jgi:hypothetical protein
MHKRAWVKYFVSLVLRYVRLERGIEPLLGDVH